MFKLFEKLFPLKPKSFDEFIELAKNEGGVKVYGQAVEEMRNGATTSAVGFIGDHLYYAVLLSWTKSGRRIIFKERIGKRWGSDGGFADSEERGLSAFKSCAAVYKLIEKVKGLLPEIETGIIDPAGEKFTPELIQKLEEGMNKYL